MNLAPKLLYTVENSFDGTFSFLIKKMGMPEKSTTSLITRKMTNENFVHIKQLQAK